MIPAGFSKAIEFAMRFVSCGQMLRQLCQWSGNRGCTWHRQLGLGVGSARLAKLIFSVRSVFVEGVPFVFHSSS